MNQYLNPASVYNNPDFAQYNALQQNGNGGSGASTPAGAFSGHGLQQVVPAKRGHDGQPFPNAPTPYAHLQQSHSNNASPSPTMQNQQFRQPPQQQQQQQQQQQHQQQRSMQNSPSPFPQQPTNFGNQMSPGSTQLSGLPAAMPSQNSMAAFNQQYGMTSNPNMSGMPNAMARPMNNMSNMDAQKAYQMRMLQHQAQLRNSGMIPPRPPGAGGQQNSMLGSGQQMSNGQQGNPPNLSAQQQQQLKRAQFLKTLASHAAQSGRQFNATPYIGGKQVDLYALFHYTVQLGGSANVDRNAQWQAIANKMGFGQTEYPSAAAELRQLHGANMTQYERLYTAMQAQTQNAAKKEQARRQAHEMAGLGEANQGSPTGMMTPQRQQQNQYAQYQQNQQQGMHAEATPRQSNAHLPQMDGMSTPQQQMLERHRRASSVRSKPEQMTPMIGGQSVATQSPHSSEKLVQRSPSVKQEAVAPVSKMDEPRSTEYTPQKHTVRDDWSGGYDVKVLFDQATTIAEHKPTIPSVAEMGVIDMRAISLSLASGIHSEVRYALDTLAEITREPRVAFDLRQCQDLIDIILDCVEEQTELLSDEAVEVSDALDLPSYEDIARSTRVEAETLQDIPAYGTQAYELDRAADKLIAVTTILRNMSWYPENHALLSSPSMIKWLSNTIRLIGTRNMLLRTFYNTQDFYKDIITFLSNVSVSLELPSKDDALHILHFLLAFAPQPIPTYCEPNTRLHFPHYVPLIHCYLPLAIDTLAKLLARQDPNRILYKSLFAASTTTSDSPLDLLTRAFALSISVLPDRTKGIHTNNQTLRIAETRKAFLWQGMLAADILTSLAPGNDFQLARTWIESEDGWAASLLHLASVLLMPQHQQQSQQRRELGPDVESFRSIAIRGLSMVRRLAEIASRDGAGGHGVVNGGGTEAGGGEAGVGRELEKGGLSWQGLPAGHSIVGALLMPGMDSTALGMFCALHDIAMQG